MVFRLYIQVGKFKIKRIVKLFQIARKLSTSGAVNTINEIHITFFFEHLFNFLSIGSNTNRIDKDKSSGKNYVWLYKEWELH